MRRVGPVVWVLLFVAGAPGLLRAQESTVYHRVLATILVADAERAGEALEDWAEEQGGYVTVKSTEAVVLRFASGELAAFRRLLESMAEHVVEYSPEAVDLAESLLGLESGIRSRDEILRRNLDYLDRADVEGTLAIEKEVTALLAEIEGLKGKLRKLTADCRLALATVRLRFTEQKLPEDVPSSFGWINTVDFYAFVTGGLVR